MSEVKLKPCPFCGGEALDATTMKSNLRIIVCIKCQATMISPDAHRAPALANKWNTRDAGWPHIDTHPTGTSMPLQFLVYTTHHKPEYLHGIKHGRRSCLPAPAGGRP